MASKNLHDSDETADNQYCIINTIESDALHKVARRWCETGLEIEAGNTLAGDYVHHRASGAKVYVFHGQYVVRGPDGEHTFDSARDAAQYAYGITAAAKQAGDDA